MSRQSAMPAGPVNRPRMFRRLTFWCTTIICLVLMLWAATNEDNWRLGFPLTGKSGDYYNRLADGLLEGHLSMKVAPDAAGHLPMLMDASLYHGRYYLYFGIVPALLTFVPYTWLSGHDLPQNLATLLLVAGGFLLSLRLYVLARRRYFPDCSPAIEACSILLLAFGTGTPILVFDANFYEVALAGGYLCISAAMLALYQSIHQERAPVAWLAMASLAAGMAVGCRATYVLALPVLLVPLALRLRSAASRPPGTAAWIRWLGAAMIPAGLVGLALMAYNYGRFDDPFEFGFKYQMNELMSCGLPFARAHFIRPNLDWYYLTRPVFSPYFPYVLPINASLRPTDYYGFELIHGQWLVLPLGLTCAAGVLWTRLRRMEHPPGLKAVIGMALLAFGCVFAALLTFGFRANRYVADFQPCLILALVLAGAFTAASSALFPRWPGRIYRLLFCGLALAVALFNYLVGIQWMDHLLNTRPQDYAALAFYGNYPSYWLTKLGFFKPSDYRFRVRFSPEVRAVARFPLMAVGTNGATDTLFVIQNPDATMQFAVDHEGYGGLRSDPFRVDLAREHEIEVRLGSLLPPGQHPYFDGWDARDVQLVKSTVRVSFDGREIITGYQSLYTASPAHVIFGRSPLAPIPPFNGQISAVERRPIARLARPTARKPAPGVWRLRVTFPPFTAQAPQPLLASGVNGAGNLLFVDYLDAAQARLGLDEWGYSFGRSPVFAYDFTRPHIFEVLIGPQFRKQRSQTGPAPAPTAADNSLVVWLDGKPIWNTPVHGNLASYDFVAPGVNIQGFSTATPFFTGVLHDDTLTEEEEREIGLRLSGQAGVAPGSGPP